MGRAIAALRIAAAVVTLGTASVSASAADGHVGAEVGHQLSLTDSGTVTTDRVYALAKADATLSRDPGSGAAWEFAAAVRGVAGEGGQELDLRALSVTRVISNLKMRFGFQEVSWGENLGFPIADLVNPRDLRDPLLLDPDWVRIPEFMVNYQLTLTPVRMQFILTPIPRAMDLPPPGGPLSLLLPSLRALPVDGPPPFDIDRAGRDAEAGTRMGTSFGGVDISLFYLWHWNRRPVYAASQGPSGARLSVVQERVQSVGVGFSRAFDAIVLRGDGVANFDDPHQGTAIGPAPRSFSAQGVFGADYAGEGGLVLGGQYQFDANSDWTLHWIAAHAAIDWFGGNLQPEILFFHGIGNPDTWIEPMLTWHSLGRVSLSVRADVVRGSNDVARGWLGPLNGLNRLFTWARIDL